MSEDATVVMGSLERVGYTKGRKDGQQEGRTKMRDAVVTALEIRFGEVSDALAEKLDIIHDLDTLLELHRDAMTVGGIEDFQHRVDDRSQD